MKSSRQFAVLAVVVGLLLNTACKKKTQPIAINKQAPTLAVPVPEQIPEEPLPAEPEAPTQEATTEQPPVKKPLAKHRPKKPAQPPANQNNPTVATNRPPANPAAEAPPDTAIAADVSSQTLTHQKDTTAQLLEAAEKTLAGLKSLSHDEESIVKQIRSYIGQSHEATKDGDFERAYNLAVKAHLLTDALIKK